MIFSIFFFCLSSFIGRAFLIKSGTEMSNGLQIIASFMVGYVMLSIVHWPIGVFAQFFHISWEQYFWIWTIILLLVVLVAFMVIRKEKKYNLRMTWFEFFVIVIGIVFGIFSLLYLDPMYHANRQDDGFYLARIVQEIGQNKIFMTNTMIGNSENMVNLIRGFNTYELFYAHWADLLNIDPTLIVRVSFTVINSVFIVSCLGIFSRYFFKNKAWLFMLCFCIFLLPNELIQKIQFYVQDGWRLNTTLWYGSTVVQMTALPLYFMLLDGLFRRKITMIKGVFIFIGLSLFYLSLASQILPISVGIALIFGCIILYQNYETKSLVIIGVSSIFCFINCILWFIPNLGIQQLYQQNLNYCMNMTTSFIGFASMSFLIARIIQQYRHRRYIPLDWILVTFLLLFLTPIISSFIMLSGQYGFVFRRVYEGFYYLLVPLSLVIILPRFSIVSEKKKLISFVGISSFSIVSLTYGIRMGAMSIRQTIENPRDTAQVISQISDYFQMYHHGEASTLLAPDRIPTSGGDFYLSSHLKTVPGTYINLGIIPRYTSKAYNIEEIQTIKSLVSCTGGIDDSIDYQKLLEQNQVDYLLLPFCKIETTPTIIPGTVVKEFIDPLMGTYWLYKLEKNLI